LLIFVKGVVHFKKLEKSCHPRCPCHSFFSRKEIKVFDENIPGFLMDFNGNQTVQGPKDLLAIGFTFCFIPDPTL